MITKIHPETDRDGNATLMPTYPMRCSFSLRKNFQNLKRYLTALSTSETSSGINEEKISLRQELVGELARNAKKFVIAHKLPSLKIFPVCY